MKTAGQRALIVLRLSRVTEESTSIERQRQVCETLCAERGYEVVGYAEDPDVSAGKTSPFERPSLGQWLRQPERFDVLVFYRLDRIVRSARHLNDLIAWGTDYSVDLVSATEAEFDTATPTGRLMVTMTATFAEMELEAIRERTRSSWHHLADQGRYTGGIPPFGYEPYQDPGTGEWVLRPEKEAAELIRQITERVLAGEGLSRIADELTKNKVLSPRDRNHVANGREPRGAGWSTSSLKRCLRNPALMGYSIHRERLTDRHGKPVKKGGRYVYGDPVIRRNPDGSPIRRSDPILPEQLFNRLQAELDRREVNKQQVNKNSDSLLIRVLYCAICGKPMYRLKGGPGRTPRYRCASAQDRTTGRCRNGTVVLSEVDDFVEKSVMEIFAVAQRLERTWDPGEDNAEELEQINLALTDLTGQLGTGVFRAGTPQREALDRRIQELAERQEQLSRSVTRTASWVWRPTGERFGEWWSQLSIPERNQYLREMGVRAFVDSDGKKYGLEVVLGELDRMAEQLELDGAAREVFAQREVLAASGSLGQVTYGGVTTTAYAPDAPGPYDRYRERGFTSFLEFRDGPTVAMRPEVKLEEVVAALRDGEQLPPDAELVEAD